MPCPCCGNKLKVGVAGCACGARFVGLPLDDTPIKVKRFGPAMISVLLLLVVSAAVLVFTKWLAFLSIVVLWASWRAMKLARRNPDWYGGYKTSATTLTLTLVASICGGAYAITRIPQALENYKLRQIAATQATMYHFVNSTLVEYKRTHEGSYPKNAQEIRIALGESIPADYWDNRMKYIAQSEGIVDSDPKAMTRTGIQIRNTNFELRSAGPDGIDGTDDDIIMRDGIFYTAAEIKKMSGVRASQGR
jgi:hypothetical protein